MRHDDVFGVQHHALGLLGETRIGFPTVNLVTQHDVPERLHVDADLMRAPRVNRAAHERRDFAETFHDRPIRVRIAPATAFVFFVDL